MKTKLTSFIVLIVALSAALCSCNRYFVTQVTTKNNLYSNADTNALLVTYNFAPYTMRNFISTQLKNTTDKVITIDWSKTIVSTNGVSNGYSFENVTPINEININPFNPLNDIANYVYFLDKTNPILSIAPSNTVTVLLNNVFKERVLTNNFKNNPKNAQLVTLLIGYYFNNEILDIKYKSVTLFLQNIKTIKKNVDLEDLYKFYNVNKNILVFSNF